MKKITSILLVICFLLSIFTITTEAADKESATTGTIDLANQISPKNLALVDILSHNMRNLKETIDISDFELTRDELKGVMSVTLIKNPDLFYVSNKRYTTGLIDDKVCVVKPHYLYNKDTIDMYSIEMDKKINKISNKINKSMSDFQKALIIHDEIVLNCKYDSNTEKEICSTIYGPLIKGEGNCEGYSLTYSYLLSLLGINSEVVISSSMHHMWNKVCLGGEYYNIDITWNDPVPDAYGMAYHKNFLFSDSKAKEQGYIDYNYKNPANNTKYDNSALHEVNSKVCYVDGTCYGIVNNSNDVIGMGIVTFGKDLDKFTLKKEMNNRWKALNGYWSKGFGGLGIYGNKLYYNTPNAIFELDPLTMKETKISTKTTEEEYYGIFIDENCLYTTLNTNPNNEGKKVLAKEFEKLFEHNGAFYQLGDVNGDGKLNILDATWIQKYCAGIIFLSNEQALRADMNTDGKVTVLDATYVQRKVLRLT